MAAASACRGPLEQVSKKVQGGGNHVCRGKEVSRTRYGERLGPRGNPREPGAFVIERTRRHVMCARQPVPRPWNTGAARSAGVPERDAWPRTPWRPKAGGE